MDVNDRSPTSRGYQYIRRPSYFGCFCLTLNMIVDTGDLNVWPKFDSMLSPTSHSCHQLISSPTSMQQMLLVAGLSKINYLLTIWNCYQFKPPYYWVNNNAFLCFWSLQGARNDLFYTTIYKNCSKFKSFKTHFRIRLERKPVGDIFDSCKRIFYIHKNFFLRHLHLKSLLIIDIRSWFQPISLHLMSGQVVMLAIILFILPESQIQFKFWLLIFISSN